PGGVLSCMENLSRTKWPRPPRLRVAARASVAGSVTTGGWPPADGHSGIGFHTPPAVHLGRAESIQFERARVLQSACAAHPERFVRHSPVPPQLPGAGWINKPMEITPTP